MIMKALLAHEKKAAAPKIPGQPASDNDSSTSESEDDTPRPGMSSEGKNYITTHVVFSAFCSSLKYPGLFITFSVSA